ncbi:hypothetical protein MKS88_005201 [Plasmodium brasilianum]|uniref:Uncharacterized protein n=1 Tax=Plasmodium brasilianum TaxID=5824 RepID=A0ACB9Y4D7_PLABR|nr:hypothetical protein MKS88_005201 [Plasmodium brasilianum]
MGICKEFIYTLNGTHFVTYIAKNIYIFEKIKVTQAHIRSRYFLRNLCELRKNGSYNLSNNRTDTNSVVSNSCGTNNFEKKYNENEFGINVENVLQQQLSNIDIDLLRKKCYEEKIQLTEEELYSLIHNLEEVPSLPDMNIIWLQVRTIEADKFANMLYNL